MRRYYLVATIMLFSYASFSQQGKDVKSDSCKFVFSSLSYFWKLDSLANNGFRVYAYDRLLSCKLDNLTYEELLEYLGKPDIIKPHNRGIEYYYYFYNGKLMKSVPGMVNEQMYLVFNYLNTSKYLESIRAGVFD